MTTEPKPGIKSTEFWFSLIVALVGPVFAALVAFGAFGDPAQADAAQNAVLGVLNALAPILGVSTPVIAGVVYTAGRNKIKQEAARSTALIEFVGTHKAARS
jgi:hypothetical protein